MAEEVNYRALTVGGTIKAGFSMITVAIAIGILFGLCMWASFELEEIGRENVATTELTGVNLFEILSYIPFGLGWLILISGIIGISTKILADGISAGLALHAAGESNITPVSIQGGTSEIVSIQAAPIPIQVQTEITPQIVAPQAVIPQL